MLKKQFRLDARKRLTNAKAFSTPLFTALICHNGLPHIRCGVIVGKKVSKKAVERNRIRRLIVTKVQENHIKHSLGMDVLFLVKKKPEDEKQLTADVVATLEKLP